MRVISKFFDYYDGVVSMGYDPTIIYKRITKQFRTSEWKNISRIDEKIISIKNSLTGGGDGYYHGFNHGKDVLNITYFKSGFIFFCGKYYPFAFYNKLPFIFYWDAESLLNDFEDKIEKYEKKYVVEYFKHSGENIPYDIFFEMEAPIIYYGNDIENGSTVGDCIRTNVNLYKIQFYKKLDAWQTFQELSMFIGGVLGSGMPKLIEIKDKDMMFKKGFDNSSFKTQSPGKKAKRRGVV